MNEKKKYGMFNTKEEVIAAEDKNKIRLLYTKISADNISLGMYRKNTRVLMGTFQLLPIIMATGIASYTGDMWALAAVPLIALLGNFPKDCNLDPFKVVSFRWFLLYVAELILILYSRQGIFISCWVFGLVFKQLLTILYCNITSGYVTKALIESPTLFYDLWDIGAIRIQNKKTKEIYLNNEATY